MKESYTPWVQAQLQQLQRYGDISVAIVIDLTDQSLVLYREGKSATPFKISSSKYGAGCRQDSNRTPLGAHRIAEKIGSNCKTAEILKARVPTGRVADIILTKDHAEEDVITSRILWLQGLQQGINSGPGVDSYQRYIYIHGTVEEGLIGTPASIGCIRMRNADVIQLFDSVIVGTLVLIAESKQA